MNTSLFINYNFRTVLSMLKIILKDHLKKNLISTFSIFFRDFYTGLKSLAEISELLWIVFFINH